MFSPYIRVMITGLLLGTIVNHTSFAQPFGIAEGTPTDQLSILHEQTHFVYKIAPKVPHPSFEGYLVLSTPETGVCKVVGIGSTIENDAYGDQTRSLFERIGEQITQKYGASKLFDFLNSGSMWIGPNYWAMGIYKNERTYDRVWIKQAKSALHDGVSVITLSVNSLGPERTYVSVSFEYENFPKCLAELKAVGAEAF